MGGPLEQGGALCSCDCAAGGCADDPLCARREIGVIQNRAKSAPRQANLQLERRFPASWLGFGSASGQGFRISILTSHLTDSIPPGMGNVRATGRCHTSCPLAIRADVCCHPIRTNVAHPPAVRSGQMKRKVISATIYGLTTVSLLAFVDYYTGVRPPILHPMKVYLLIAGIILFGAASILAFVSKRHPSLCALIGFVSCCPLLWEEFHRVPLNDLAWSVRYRTDSILAIVASIISATYSLVLLSRSRKIRESHQLQEGE